MRYERLASIYKALVTIASIIIHLRYGILGWVHKKKENMQTTTLS
jgi:hypothetical protein